MYLEICTQNLNRDRPHLFWCLREPLMMRSLYKNKCMYKNNNKNKFIWEQKYEI